MAVLEPVPGGRRPPPPRISARISSGLIPAGRKRRAELATVSTSDSRATTKLTLAVMAGRSFSCMFSTSMITL